MTRPPFLVLCILAASCARLPTGPEGAIPVPSPNFDERHPNFVILHQTTDDTADDALATLTNPDRKVSAHYLIGRDGTLYQLVAEERRAWHAGASWWGGNTDLNSSSIGIELDNNGAEPFADAQIARLLTLLRDVKDRHRIPQANFLAHGDVAPTRKVDPSALFPWRRLADAGFGLWCYEPEGAVHGHPDVALALQALGYDVANPAAALAAFRRHYRGIESDTPPDEMDVAALDCLVRQKRVAARQP